jgi:hypothetical protein
MLQLIEVPGYMQEYGNFLFVFVQDPNPIILKKLQFIVGNCGKNLPNACPKKLIGSCKNPLKNFNLGTKELFTTDIVSMIV